MVSSKDHKTIQIVLSVKKFATGLIQTTDSSNILS